MKQRVFQLGLKYVFSYKKYKQESRRLKLKPFGWEKSLNGKPVISVINKSTAMVYGEYLVNANWCKCIGRM